MKLRWASNEKNATRFLRLLKFLGKGRKKHPKMALKAVIRRAKEGRQIKRVQETHGTEDT